MIRSIPAQSASLVVSGLRRIIREEQVYLPGPKFMALKATKLYRTILA